LLTHRQTNKQTNKNRQKHNLLGGGKNASDVYAIASVLFPNASTMKMWNIIKTYVEM